MSTTAEAKPGLTLTLRLVGRIVIVEHCGTYTALFLDARRNPELGFQKHKPALCGPFDRVQPNIARRGDSALADPSGAAQGLWSLKGYDLRFEALLPPTQVMTGLQHLADLNRIYDSVGKSAKWREAADLLHASDPRRFGIAARLSLAGFSSICAVPPPEGTLLSRRFKPGSYKQEIHGMVECIGHFAGAKPGPRICGESFDGCRRPVFELKGDKDLDLAMSNLCHCAAEVRHPEDPDDPQWVLDDEEFALYYELLIDPPPCVHRPVPYRLKEGGGGGVPECYDPATLRV